MAAQRAVEEAAQRKAEEEAAALREAEEEAQKKAAAEAEAKRQADEALAEAEAERQQAEAEAQAEGRRRGGDARGRRGGAAQGRGGRGRRKGDEEARPRPKPTARRQGRGRGADQGRDARRSDKAEAEVGAEEGGEAAEKALRLEPADRQRLQLALTSLGFDTRGNDGLFGAAHARDDRRLAEGAQPPATGFLTAAQQQALLKEAAPAVAKFDEERKKSRRRGQGTVRRRSADTKCCRRISSAHTAEDRRRAVERHGLRRDVYRRCQCRRYFGYGLARDHGSPSDEWAWRRHANVAGMQSQPVLPCCFCCRQRQWRGISELPTGRLRRCQGYVEDRRRLEGPARFLYPKLGTLQDTAKPGRRCLSHNFDRRPVAVAGWIVAWDLFMHCTNCRRYVRNSGVHPQLGDAAHKRSGFLEAVGCPRRHYIRNQGFGRHYRRQRNAIPP